MLLGELSDFFLTLCENKCSNYCMIYGHLLEFLKCSWKEELIFLEEKKVTDFQGLNRPMENEREQN